MKFNDLISDMERFAKKENVPIMQKESLDYLISFIKQHDIKSVLEVGTAIGYSTILIKEVVNNITSIERDEERYNIAVKNVELSNLNNITLIKADALDITITDKFDLIFIDAAKGKNKEFLDKFKSNLNENGYIIIDNMDFHGLVGKSMTIEKRRLRSLVKKIENFIKYMEEQTEFKVTKIDKGDGLYLLERI
ncbi:MAG TPA: SAM-dependent methyltransferase [Firmicutes bacterium]|nr:SAM-dependent methyltransferase [Bacillota bacterium]